MKEIFLRDLRQSTQTGGGFGLALLFYAAFALLIPLGVGPDIELHLSIAPGILWVGSLLSCLLSLDSFFSKDHEDGTLERLMLAPVPVEAIVCAKAAAHWTVVSLPLCVASPVVGLMLNLPLEAGAMTALTMCVGTPAFSMIGAFGAAMTLGLRRSALLLPVLVVPASIPTLIFGSVAAGSAAQGLPAMQPLSILLAVSLACAAVLPFAAAYLLRINLRR